MANRRRQSRCLQPRSLQVALLPLDHPHTQQARSRNPNRKQLKILRRIQKLRRSATSSYMNEILSTIIVFRVKMCRICNHILTYRSGSKSCSINYLLLNANELLHSDYCTNEFLRKLMPPGSPTFFEYTQPPIDILDIGCGRGYWAAEAATTWKHKNAYVTAFDIVDLGRPLRQSLEPDISAHILWVQGNLYVVCVCYTPLSY